MQPLKPSSQIKQFSLSPSILWAMPGRQQVCCHPVDKYECQNVNLYQPVLAPVTIAVFPVSRTGQARGSQLPLRCRRTTYASSAVEKTQSGWHRTSNQVISLVPQSQPLPAGCGREEQGATHLSSSWYYVGGCAPRSSSAAVLPPTEELARLGEKLGLKINN